MSRPRRSFAGLILAGGEGTRWGGPKAWARLPDGTTFLAACARALGGAGAALVVATLPPGASTDLAGVEGLALPEPDLDMFASVTAGLRHLAARPWDRVVILPVDHPLVETSTVVALAAADAEAGIATLHGRHGHPLFLSRTVATRIVDGSWPGPTLRHVLRTAAAVDVDVDDPGVRANCNTPESLAAALAARRGGRG